MEVNKIYNEDCLEGMKRIEDKSIDMILTDYNSGLSLLNIILITIRLNEYLQLIM